MPKTPLDIGKNYVKTIVKPFTIEKLVEGRECMQASYTWLAGTGNSLDMNKVESNTITELIKDEKDAPQKAWLKNVTAPDDPTVKISINGEIVALENLLLPCHGCPFTTVQFIRDNDVNDTVLHFELVHFTREEMNLITGHNLFTDLDSCMLASGILQRKDPLSQVPHAPITTLISRTEVNDLNYWELHVDGEPGRECPYRSGRFNVIIRGFYWGPDGWLKVANHHLEDTLEWLLENYQCKPYATRRPVKKLRPCKRQIDSAVEQHEPNLQLYCQIMHEDRDANYEKHTIKPWD